MVAAAPEAGSTGAPAAAASVAGKPFSAGGVAIDASAASDGELTATSAPFPGLDEPRLVFASTGEVEVTGTDASTGSSPTTVTATIEVDEGADPRDPAEAALADAGGSMVVATLRADAPAGGVRTSSDRVWVDEFRGATLVSSSGEQDLRLQRVDVLEDEGEVDAAEAEALRNEVRTAGAATTTTEGAGPCAGELCVSGVIRWTDSVGATHPVDRAAVQLWDDEAPTDVQIGSTVTDGAGGYSIVVADNDDGDGTGYDGYVRVLADGPGFTLDHRIESTPQPDLGDGSLTVDLAANNTDDANTAFSVRAALVIGHDQVVQLHGSPLPSIPVQYPDPEGSFYDGSSLHILGTDRFDWDVVLHEYGHHVADELDIEDNPGGPHSLSQNLSDARGSKVVGTRLAWGEGWPSFFAVSTLLEDAAGLGVPNVGDSRYQDTVDSSIDVSLEARAQLGEDNERTVANVLWDLYDANADHRDTVQLGAQAVWDVIDAGDPTRLSQVYALFSPNKGREGVNCVFTDMNVAPRVDGASPTPAPAPGSPPTIRWRRGNGGTHRNDQFSVVFRDADGRLLHNTTFRTGQSHRPSPGVWREVRALSEGAVRVSVVGRQTDEPLTGPYRGCSRVFTVA